MIDSTAKRPFRALGVVVGSIKMFGGRETPHSVLLEQLLRRLSREIRVGGG
jgi:hypothetical protein